MNAMRFLTFSLLVLLVSVTSSRAEDGFIQISGTVTFDDAAPAANTYVTAGQFTTAALADASGDFDIDVAAGIVGNVRLDFNVIRDGVTHLAVIEVDGTTEGPLDAGTIVLKSNCDGHSVVTNYWAQTADLVWQGDRLFTVGCNGWFRIFDVSDPANLVETTAWTTFGCTQGLAVNGQYAYMAVTGGNFLIVDWTTSPEPTLVGWVTVGPSTTGVRMFNSSYMIVRDGSTGIAFIDVSDPTTPVIHWSPVGGEGNQVFVRGTDVFVSTDDGLKILDATDPTNAQLVSSILTPGLRADDVHVDGDYAYVADYQVGMTVIDISNLAAPSIVTTMTTNSCWGVYVENDLAYLAGDNLSGWDMIVADVSDPTNPVALSGLLVGGLVSQQQLLGGRGFVGGAGGSRIYSIDMRDRLGWMAASLTETNDSAFGVVLDGSTAMVAADDDGLLIYDVSDATSPTLIGVANVPGGSRAVALDASYAYVVGTDGLQIVDVANPATPLLLGGVATAGTGDHVEVDGDYAYVTDGDLQIIDVSDKSSPSIVKTIPGTINDVAVRANTAYVADTFAGLLIVDISDPPTAAIVNDRPGSTLSVEVFDDTLLLDEWFGGTEVLDISAPRNPLLLSEVPVQGELVMRENEFAALQGRVTIVDITDRTQPEIIRAIDQWDGTGPGVALADEYVYIPTSEGLQIVDRGCQGPDASPPVSVPTAHIAPFALNVITANPIRRSVTVEISLREPTRVGFGVFDVTGRRVWVEPEREYGVGTHALVWDGRNRGGRNVSPGVYFVRASSDVGTATRKITVLR